MKLTQLTFSRLRQEIFSGLTQLYQKAGQTLSDASPFGQILSVITAIGQNVFMYIENVAQEANIYTARNRKSIRSLAAIAGHDPTRSISASGILRFTLKSNIDLLKEIRGGQFTIYNNTKLVCTNNSLIYSVNIGEDQRTYYVDGPGFTFTLPVIQGKLLAQIITGSGNPFQIINIQSSRGDIEQFNVYVYVNGELWDRIDHMYDALPNQKVHWQRSGFPSGCSIIFGNGSYGAIPPVGATIEVKYLASDGIKGNILSINPNSFTFIDPIYDQAGQELDMGSLFDIFLEEPINFGSNGESINYTREVIPWVSRNMVLARPENFAYHLKKLGIFSLIHAYTLLNETGEEIDRVIFLYLVPDLRQYTSSGTGYFELPLDRFYLNDTEKKRIILYLRGMGSLVIGTRLEIVDVRLSRYVCFVRVVIFEDANEEQVRASIIGTIGSYFLNISRLERIPSSDIDSLLEQVSGIDSVKTQFVCEKNEIYHRNGLQTRKRLWQIARQTDPNIKEEDIVVPGYNPSLVLGIDPNLGDIVFENTEVPLIRGGWSDRYSNTYTEAPQPRAKSAVNIEITARTKRTFRPTNF